MSAPVYPGTRIPLIAARSELQLAGRAGYTIALLPGGRDHQFSFTPEAQDCNFKAPAGDLDLQIMWVKAEKPENNPPLVYWRIEYGHGECTYGVPQFSSLGAAAPELFNTRFGWMLPQRGLRLRFPARAIKLFFFVPPTAPPPEPVLPGGAPCTLQVSVQPCFGMEPQRLPLTDCMFADPVLPGNPVQFPLGATEMRFCDPISGLPFAASEEVTFYDITGTATGAPVGLVSLGDWLPIPMFAAFWAAMDAATQASYR